MKRAKGTPLISVTISQQLHARITKRLERQGDKIRYGETRRRVEHLIMLGLAEEKKARSRQLELPL